MSSGRSLPIPGAQIAPLNPGDEGGSTAAGGVQSGDQPLGGFTAEGSVAQPSVGTGGGQVAQPGVAVTGDPPVASGSKTGQSAEERIQSLVTKVGQLEAQLSEAEEMRELRDELEETLDTVQSLMTNLKSASVQPPGGPTPSVQPTQKVDPAIAALMEKVDKLSTMVARSEATVEEKANLAAYEAVESDLLTKAGITKESEVAQVKRMIDGEMDRGKYDWTKPRIARRVVKGQIEEFQKLKNDLISSSVRTPPSSQSQAVAQPATPATTPTVPAQQDEGISPLDQAASELGPLVQQIFRKGGGVI